MSCGPSTVLWPRSGDSAPKPPTTTVPPQHLQDVWVAVRASLRNVLERVSLEDVVAGRLPRTVAKLTEDPDAWEPRR